MSYKSDTSDEVILWATTSAEGVSFISHFPEPTVPVQPVHKIKCIHCGQRQPETNDECQFCGAPLPLSHRITKMLFYPEER